MTVRPREDRPGRAVAILLSAFVLFTTLDISAKWLVTDGMPPLQVVAMRFGVHFVLALVFFLPQGGFGVVRSRVPVLQAGRALSLFLATITNFFALKYLTLSVTTAIIFAAPVLVCLLSIPLLGERVGARRLIAVGIGFVGVLIVVNPWSAGIHPAMGLSLITMAAAAIYFILTRMIAGREDNPTGQIWISGIPTLALVPLVIEGWVWPAGWGVLHALGLGICGAVGHSLLTIGQRYGEASALAPLVYVQVVYASAASWLIFAEPPGVSTLLGTAVIVASGLYIWLREQRLRA
ncbi:MAG: DMT family transporter [Pseudomonadota bacterium]